MNETLTLVAAATAGLLTSASPCVLAAVPVAVGYVGGQAQSSRRSWALSLAFVAGLNVALLVLGLLAARLGRMLGTLPGPWTVAVGAAVVLLAIVLWRADPACHGSIVPLALQRRLDRSGAWGALVLGALIGTVMSPCATPALAAALTLAGSGDLFGSSMLWGTLMLLAYGIGHSVVVLVAGAMPAAATALIDRVEKFAPWLPGRRAFLILMLLAGLWWVATGAQLLGPR